MTGAQVRWICDGGIGDSEGGDGAGRVLGPTVHADLPGANDRPGRAAPIRNVTARNGLQLAGVGLDCLPSPA